jgi:hypothetical protein
MSIAMTCTCLTPVVLFLVSRILKIISITVLDKRGLCCGNAIKADLEERRL